MSLAANLQKTFPIFVSHNSKRLADMNRFILSLSTAFYLITATTFSALAGSVVPDDKTLAHEGARLGRAFNIAMKAGDAKAQNDIINEFNSILVTLKKQSQADILTGAFNNCNVPITRPETDAILYSRALMNAHISKDPIAIEDAEDISETVKKIYATDREAQEADRFSKLYECAVNGARLGYEYSLTNDSTRSKAITDNASVTRNTICSADSLSIKVFNDSFDYYSINLTTPENDAEIYSKKMKQATASGKQSDINAIARIVGYVYERYSFDRSKEEADKFNSLLNSL